MSTLKIGVIGYGYWSANVVRSFYNTPNATVVSVCDIAPRALQRIQRTYPTMAVNTSPDALLTGPAIASIAIVTAITHHFPLAKKALENGTHIFVEKAFTANSSEALELLEIAERKNLRIMVDHTFLFNGAVRKIRELIEN